jgi:hypothetical protein
VALVVGGDSASVDVAVPYRKQRRIGADQGHGRRGGGREKSVRMAGCASPTLGGQKFGERLPTRIAYAFAGLAGAYLGNLSYTQNAK